MVSNASNGHVEGNADFNEFPNDVHPAIASISFLSISCSNNSDNDGDAANIFQIAKNDYTSIRRIEAFDGQGNFLGSIEINGKFTKTGNNSYSAQVTVSGTYNGPTDLLIPSGYVLPLNPDGSHKLQGSFSQNISTKSGQTITTTNEHVYFFDGGTTQELKPIEFELSYDESQTYWNPDENFLNLVGTSIVRPQ